MGLNSCSFIGNLVADPDSRAVSGKTVTKFRVAVNDGGKDTPPEYVNVETWERTAEICAEYLSKGSKIYFSGRMKTDKYTGKDGVERYFVKVVAYKVEFLGGGNGGSNEGAGTGQAQNRNSQAQGGRGYRGQNGSQGGSGQTGSRVEDAPF